MLGDGAWESCVVGAVLGVVLGVAVPVAAQGPGIDPVALEAAGRLVDAGRMRRGCNGLEAVIEASRLPTPALRERLHRDRSFARWVRGCVASRLADARATPKLQARARRLVELAASPLLFDRVQEPMVLQARDQALDELRAAGLPAPLPPVPAAPVSAVDIRSAIQSAMPAMRRCIERRARTGSVSLLGIDITVDGTGRVRGVAVTSRGTTGASFERCVEQALSAVPFPADGMRYRIRYPFTIDMSN